MLKTKPRKIKQCSKSNLIATVGNFEIWTLQNRRSMNFQNVCLIFYKSFTHVANFVMSLWRNNHFTHVAIYTITNVNLKNKNKNGPIY